jgi:hypothetical protein
LREQEVRMSSGVRSVADIVRRSFVTVVCCLAVGFVFYRWNIFNYHDPAFQFLAFGIVGSMFFFTLRVNARNSLAVLFVLFVIHSGLVTRALQHGTLLRDVLFFAAIAGALSLFFVVFYRPRELSRPIDPLVLATLFALTYFIAIVILDAAEGNFWRGFAFSYVTRTLIPLMTYGFLMGFGLGIGIFVTDRHYLQRARESMLAMFRELTEQRR